MYDAVHAASQSMIIYLLEKPENILVMLCRHRRGKAKKKKKKEVNMRKALI